MDNNKLPLTDYYGVLDARVARCSHVKESTTTTFIDHLSVSVEEQIRPHDCVLSGVSIVPIE